MQIQPSIKKIDSKTLVGMQMKMSLTANKTGELFRTFMPRRREIMHTVNQNNFDLRIYPKGYFEAFNPATEFTKWALAEVGSIDNIPEGMKVFELKGGLYAVFPYKGLNMDNSIFQYIFAIWLPNSIYELDDRPHFEILGEKTRMNDPDSEEEICIPVKLKK